MLNSAPSAWNWNWQCVIYLFIFLWKLFCEVIFFFKFLSLFLWTAQKRWDDSREQQVFIIEWRQLCWWWCFTQPSFSLKRSSLSTWSSVFTIGRQLWIISTHWHIYKLLFTIWYEMEVTGGGGQGRRARGRLVMSLQEMCPVLFHVTWSVSQWL